MPNIYVINFINIFIFKWKTHFIKETTKILHLDASLLFSFVIICIVNCEI